LIGLLEVSHAATLTTAFMPACLMSVSLNLGLIDGLVSACTSLVKSAPAGEYSGFLDVGRFVPFAPGRNHVQKAPVTSDSLPAGPTFSNAQNLKFLGTPASL
jgi:hypothetical protein